MLFAVWTTTCWSLIWRHMLTKPCFTTIMSSGVSVTVTDKHCSMLETTLDQTGIRGGVWGRSVAMSTAQTRLAGLQQ